MVIDSPDLGRMVAQKLGGRHYDLHAPVLVERAMVRDMFLSEPMVKESILRARMVKLAIMGIGTDDLTARHVLEISSKEAMVQ